MGITDEERAWVAELTFAFYSQVPFQQCYELSIARHVLENAALWSDRLGVTLPAPEEEPDFGGDSIPGCDCGCNGSILDDADLDFDTSTDILNTHTAAMIGTAIAAFQRELGG